MFGSLMRKESGTKKYNILEWVITKSGNNSNATVSTILTLIMATNRRMRLNRLPPSHTHAPPLCLGRAHAVSTADLIATGALVDMQSDPSERRGIGCYRTSPSAGRSCEEWASPPD